jgi:hypothetical protein
VPIDYEQLRAARIRVAEQNRESDWSLREKAIVDRDRATLAAQRAAEQHQRELAAAVTWATAKSAAAREAGDPDNTALWSRAAQTLKEGRWPVCRRVASSPDVVRHQAVRTRLLYEGQSARLDDQ